MRETFTYGTVGGASGNWRIYPEVWIFFLMCQEVYDVIPANKNLPDFSDNNSYFIRRFILASISQ